MRFIYMFYYVQCSKIICLKCEFSVLKSDIENKPTEAAEV